MPVSKRGNKMKVKVKVIGNQGMSSLVEWVIDGVIERGYVPTGMVEEDHVNGKELELAIPYGLPFASLITFQANPVDLERELHRLGIWTFEDMTRDPNACISALQRVYATDYAALRIAAMSFNETKT